tara:strand:- start:40 stop:210 length:171 start_codon:yes stop_codon:yes gene_type:complete
MSGNDSLNHHGVFIYQQRTHVFGYPMRYAHISILADHSSRVLVALYQEKDFVIWRK